MFNEEAELAAFHKANPYIDEQAYGLRTALEGLDVYSRFLLRGGANPSQEMDEAIGTIRSSLKELQEKQNERCRITMVGHISRIRAGRKA